jgi:hypothetical protein
VSKDTALVDPNTHRERVLRDKACYVCGAVNQWIPVSWSINLDEPGFRISLHCELEVRCTGCGAEITIRWQPGAVAY